MSRTGGLQSAAKLSTRRRRRSSLKELDLDAFPPHEHAPHTAPARGSRPRRHVRFQSKSDVFEASDSDDPLPSAHDLLASPRVRRPPDYTVSLKMPAAPGAPRQSSPLFRFFPLALVVALLVAFIRQSPLVSKPGRAWFGVDAGAVKKRRDAPAMDTQLVEKRDYDPTNYCTRWSQQTALVNGTLYSYGGRSTQSPGQTANTWNNDFLSLDLTKTWQISAPALAALAQPPQEPSGPPPTANGYLWNSYQSLFLYGGEYSDTPPAPPLPYAMWEYNLGSRSWTEHSAPRTLNGTNSDGGNQPVQAAAEGAGISVPELGRAWYFGGHQDGYTTAGWSQSIPRIYLKSLLEYTFPGFSNNAIPALQDGQPAGLDGAWRNITEGGLQDTDGFTVRADGVLVYVPGYAEQGIILGLAGGTEYTFTEINIIDVYDIAASTWYKQTISGQAPAIRVNPCAVAASAADGSSTQVYMYGGQTLQPYEHQLQYDDVWILTIPSFTWIQADISNSSVSVPGRSGHTCNIWDGQIVVLGGYVGPNISCDAGVYVFDASELKWQPQFTALTGADTQNQQASQSQNASGLSGSYGYRVPPAVQSVIGGNALGGATVTAPAQTATAGPLATGKPILYTVTASSGATETVSSNSGGSGPAGGTGSTGGSGSEAQNSGPNVAAIAAGSVAGVLFLIACYLGFCAWVYRRQLLLYKNHVAQSQHAAAAGGPTEKQAFLAARRQSEDHASRPTRSEDRSSLPSGTGTQSGSNAAASGAVPPQTTHGRLGGNSTANSSTDDLMTGQEPSFVGVLLNPRRSLRVINRD